MSFPPPEDVAGGGGGGAATQPPPPPQANVPPSTMDAATMLKANTATNATSETFFISLFLSAHCRAIFIEQFCVLSNVSQ